MHMCVSVLCVHVNAGAGRGQMQWIPSVARVRGSYELPMWVLGPKSHYISIQRCFHHHHHPSSSFPSLLPSLIFHLLYICIMCRYYNYFISPSSLMDIQICFQYFFNAPQNYLLCFFPYLYDLCIYIDPCSKFTSEAPSCSCCQDEHHMESASLQKPGQCLEFKEQEEG